MADGKFVGLLVSIDGTRRAIEWFVAYFNSYEIQRTQNSKIHFTSVLSTAGTMFELVQALRDGANALKSHYLNSISINAGCELFIEFVRLFPHETKVRLYILLPSDERLN